MPPNRPEDEAAGPPGRNAVEASAPADLRDATAAEAGRDADRVAAFLRAIGIAPAPARPVRLPAASLLALGAALRLWQWERSGLDVHLQAGLPSAERALTEALESLGAAEARSIDELSRRVVALFAERFAWRGRSELGADVVLDDPDDDVMLEALAQLLWASRRSGRGRPDGLTESPDE
ncbi:hypothetical protein [Paludisphaera soli]|uniref:hypothetical protein n=1 Tax=Paludisphaera soli TaxID=2712865 RepID=UPI0013ED00E2|nr:hypothetical protein [Paludisphaera soli]